MSTSPPIPVSRLSVTAFATGLAGGLVNAAVVVGLYAHGEYPVLESTTATAVLALTAACVGFVPLFLAAYTRLIVPAVGVLAALLGTVWLEVTTPTPEWGELGGFVIVDGPTHASSYANTWYLWLALAVLAAVVEFRLRQQYGVGADRLRNLPETLSRANWIGIVSGTALLLGAASSLLVVRSGIGSTAGALVVFFVAAAVTAVPLWATFEDGAIVPLALYLPVPYFLVIEVFVTTDSPVHLLLFGPYAIVLAIVWLLERTIRTRFGSSGVGGRTADGRRG